MEGTPRERNPWQTLPSGAQIRTGHCRRCESGLGHDNMRRSATRRAAGKPSGTILQSDRRDYTDEMPQGAKVIRRREIRRAERMQAHDITRAAYYGTSA